MKKSTFLIAFWLLASLPALSIFAEEGEGPIVVSLATESALDPLYLLPMTKEQSELSESTVRQLEQILTFDLNHNGATFVSKRTPENDQFGQSGTFNQLGSASGWKERNIYYVVKPQIQGNKLALIMLDVQKQALKSADSFPLTGNINEDRRQIHRAADVIHKALIETDGIASTKILYTIKTQNSSDSSKAISEVWECDYDGGNPRQLTQERTTCVTPVYLPPKPGYTSGAFLYVSYILGQPKIYIASLKEGKSSRLTYLRGNQLMPAISQQRDKVAFISDVTGNPDLFLQNFSLEKGLSANLSRSFLHAKQHKARPHSAQMEHESHLCQTKMVQPKFMSFKSQSLELALKRSKQL